MKGSRPFLTFLPRTTEDSIYVIKSMAANNEGMYSALASVYKIDYETIHNRLAHPSRDVITTGWKHLKDFPRVEVPAEDPLCPGCAQGKMTNRSFPATPRRATQPFQLIHSDLKSLPIESYRKFKYAIIFFDDYSSHAWTVNMRVRATLTLSSLVTEGRTTLSNRAIQLHPKLILPC